MLVPMLTCLVALVLVSQAEAQPTEDVLYLKNGSVIRGTIIEQIPGESLKIQTQGGSVFVHAMEEISRIAKEPMAPLPPYLQGREGGLRTEAGAPDGEVELGMLFGVSRLSDDTGTLTMIQLPGGGVLGAFGPLSALPSLHVSWLAGEQLAIGPEFAFGRTAAEFEDEEDDFDLSISAFMVGGRAAFYPGGNSMPGIYLLGQSSLSWLEVEFVGEDESETDYSVGLGMGYQWRIDPAFVLRMEAQYRRWLDAETDNYSLVLGLGTRLGGR